MSKPHLYILMTVTLLVVSCAKPITSNKKGSTPTPTNLKEYDEDLSVVRPKFESNSTDIEKHTDKNKEKTTSYSNQLPPSVNKDVDTILETMATKNQSIQFAPGYRIQVYVGNDRKGVDETKAFIYQNFPELNVYLSYSQPTYKLKTGDFLTRIDAERYYAILKQQYSNAMMVADKIDIKKSLLIK